MPEPRAAPGPEKDPPAAASITPMRREDLEAIVAIEQQSHPRPWPREVFLEEQHRDWAHVDVLRAGERVLGYLNYWLVGDEVHLLNLAVDPPARGRGLGARLVEHLLAAAAAARARFVTLEVRRTNRAALALYRRHEFRPVGVRPRYYDNGEDAIVMIRDL